MSDYTSYISNQVNGFNYKYYTIGSIFIKVIVKQTLVTDESLITFDH